MQAVPSLSMAVASEETARVALCRRRGSLYVHDSSAATAGIANLPLIAWQGSGIRSLFQLARHSLVVGFDSSVLSLSTCMHMLIWLLTVLA